MENKKLKSLISNLASRKKTGQEYTPKFIKNDIAILKFKEQNVIVRILELIRDETDLACANAHYQLQTLFNNGVKKKLYKRIARVQAIDAYYKLIKPETARVLYGIEVEDKKKDREEPWRDYEPD